MGSALAFRIDDFDVAVGDDGIARVGAFAIAARAGLKQPRNIKAVVEDNRNELEQHGPLPMRTQVVRIEKRGAIRGVELREVEEPLLNEDQACNLIILMRTPIASALRVALVRLFHTVRDNIEPARPSLTTSTIGAFEDAKEEIRDATILCREKRGYSTQQVYGHIRAIFNVSSPWKIPIDARETVRTQLKLLASGRLSLGRSRRRPRPRDERQPTLPGMGL